MSKLQEAFKDAVEEYTGATIKEISLWEDGGAKGTYALRAVVTTEHGRKKERTLDFLAVTGALGKFVTDAGAHELALTLEECEFKTWPPESRSR